MSFEIFQAVILNETFKQPRKTNSTLSLKRKTRGTTKMHVGPEERSGFNNTVMKKVISIIVSIRSIDSWGEAFHQ